MMENLSAVLYGSNDLRMEHVHVKDPEAKEVQVHVRVCGICISDGHMLEMGGVLSMPIICPNVIGHEIGGVVSKVGSDVTHVKPGDRIAVDPVSPCLTCPHCRKGYGNTCPNVVYTGFPPKHGGLTRYVNIVSHCVFKIPDSIDFEEAALTEPVSVCWNVCERADIRGGQCVVIMGAGPIGLICLQIARTRGASVVCVADIKEDRLELAKELGATHTVLFTKDETDARANAQKLRDTIGDLADATLECTGVQLCLQTCVHATRARGVVTLVGIGADDMMIPVSEVLYRELDIKGTLTNNCGFPAAIKLLESKKVKVKPFISHRFQLEDTPRALDLCLKREITKAVIECSQD